MDKISPISFTDLGFFRLKYPHEIINLASFQIRQEICRRESVKFEANLKHIINFTEI
jgi:hypothetical protein